MNRNITIFQDDISAELGSTLQRQDIVAWDIETSGLDWQREGIGTCQLYTEETGPLIIQMGTESPRHLRQLIANPAVTKLFHHAMFDLRFMANAWQVRPVNIECTKVASKLLWPNEEGSCHSLKGLLQHLLAVKISKAARISDWMAETLTPAQVSYAVSDVVHLVELRKILLKYLEDSELRELYQRCVEFLPTQVQLEIGGWPNVFSY